MRLSSDVDSLCLKPSTWSEWGAWGHRAVIHKPHNLTVSNSVLELGDSEESLPQKEQRWSRQIC